MAAACSRFGVRWLLYREYGFVILWSIEFEGLLSALVVLAAWMLEFRWGGVDGCAASCSTARCESFLGKLASPKRRPGGLYFDS